MHAILAALNTTLLPSYSCDGDISNSLNALDDSTLLCLTKNQDQWSLSSHTPAAYIMSNNILETYCWRSTTLENNNSVEKWSYYSIRYYKPKSSRKATTYNKYNIPDILHLHTTMTA